MSKKSRKRNKKILAAIGLGLGAVALANRKPKQSDVSQDSGRGSGLRDTVDTPKKKPVTKKTTTTKVSTPTTVMDSMPTRPKLNQDSIRSKNGKVFTIKGAKAGEKAKVSGIDTPGIAINDKGNITAGGKQYYDKNQYKTRNDKPGMLGDSGFTSPKTGTTARGSSTFSDKIKANNERIRSGLRSGGRAGYKSGGSTGSSKASGCAIRGTSPILLKGKK